LETSGAVEARLMRFWSQQKLAGSSQEVVFARDQGKRDTTDTELAGCNRSLE
jgi:hypothetical protein